MLEKTCMVIVIGSLALIGFGFGVWIAGFYFISNANSAFGSYFIYGYGTLFGVILMVIGIVEKSNLKRIPLRTLAMSLSMLVIFLYGTIVFSFA